MDDKEYQTSGFFVGLLVFFGVMNLIDVIYVLVRAEAVIGLALVKTLLNGAIFLYLAWWLKSHKS